MVQAPIFWNIKLFSFTLFLNSLNKLLVCLQYNAILFLNTLLIPNIIMTYGKIISQNLIFLSLEDIETKLKLG